VIGLSVIGLSVIELSVIELSVIGLLLIGLPLIGRLSLLDYLSDRAVGAVNSQSITQ
jgi:hypothetical protein